MSSPDRQLLGSPRRQSPLAVVFLAIRLLRQLGFSQLIIIALLIFNAPLPGGVLVVIPLLAFVLFAFSTLAWWRYTFVVSGDELLVSRGVVSQDRLTIPLDRVQSVSIDQQFLHRLVGLVKASVDSAGTSEAEFTIDAIERPVAEALQRVAAEHVTTAVEVMGDEGAPPPPVAPDVVLVRRTPSELVKIAISQSPWTGLAVLPPLAVVADDLGGALGIGLPDFESPEFGAWLVWLAVLVFVLGTALSIVLQLSREFLTNWDLTLASTSTGFRRSAGLLSKTSRSSSYPRVQRLGTRQNPVQRWLGIRSVTMPTIGEGDLHVPGCTDEETARIRQRIIDGADEVRVLERRISPASVFLAVRNASVLSILGGTALVVTIGWWGLLVFLAIPWTWFVSRRRQARTRWGVSAGGVALHDETFAVSTNEMALRKVQTATVRQSFFERRRDLATVRLAAADGGVTIPLIPLGEARALRDVAVFVAETDHRAWM